MDEMIDHSVWNNIFNYQAGGDQFACHPLTPYCVSKLIQILLGCYRFYIYPKCPKINTFQNGRCTRAPAATVLLFGISVFLVFQMVKNNDNPFFIEAVVIFCTQEIISTFANTHSNLNFQSASGCCPLWAFHWHSIICISVNTALKEDSSGEQAQMPN